MKKESRRQELGKFVASGQLRQALRDKHISSDAIQLLIDIADRYCTVGRTKKVTAT